MRDTTWLLVSVLLFPALLSPGNLPEKHLKWLNEEVIYIISERERAKFLKLGSDEERDAFVEKFWKIRDSDSGTQENEFRTEHYARIRHANERFNDGVPGWKSERGRIWIMHGPPDDIRYEYGGGSLGIDIENPTQALTGDANPDRRRLYRITFNRPETEIWVYRRIETAKNFPSNFEIIFSRTDPVHVYELVQNLQHISSGSTMNYGDRVRRDFAVMTFIRGHFFGGSYKIVYAGEYRFQDLDDFFQSVFHPYRSPSLNVADFQVGIQDLERSPGEVLMEKLDLGRNLKEKVRSRIFFEEIPLTFRAGTLRSSSGAPLLPICVGLTEPLGEGNHAADRSDTLDLLLELVAPDGDIVASLADSVIVKAMPELSAGNRKLLYQARLSARPGRYRLQVYAILRARRASAIREMEVQLPDYGSEDFSMSDLLLFDKVLPKEEYKRSADRTGDTPRFLGRSNPVFLKDFVLIPSSDSRFRRGQNLIAFFEVYNPAVPPGGTDPILNVRCRLKREDGHFQELPEKLLNYLTSSDTRRTTYGVSIPLLSSVPGQYTIEFDILDRVQGKSISKAAVFTVF